MDTPQGAAHQAGTPFRGTRTTEPTESQQQAGMLARWHTTRPSTAGVSSGFTTLLTGNRTDFTSKTTLYRRGAGFTSHPSHPLLPVSRRRIRHHGDASIQPTMGVSGLFPLLKSIQRQSELKKYAGKTLAVDAYGWLHRGTVACASELAQGKDSRKYVASEPPSNAPTSCPRRPQARSWACTDKLKPDMSNSP